MYKIPSRRLVQKTIEDVLTVQGEIDSQKNLRELAIRRLKKKNPRFQLSPARARRIALQTPNIVAVIRTRKTTNEEPDICPCCRTRLKKISGKNLYGESTIISKRCPNCTYETGIGGRRVPRRYIFRYRGK